MSLEYVMPLAAGLSLGAVFVVWKKTAQRWETWFPLLKKSAQWLLYATFAAALFFVLKELPGEDDPSYLMKWLVLAVGFLAPFFAVGGGLFAGSIGQRHERGAHVALARAVKWQVRKERKKADLAIGGVPIPVDAEPYHFLIAGSTGSGKSVAIIGLLDAIRKRGDTAIIVDSGGEFLKRYYNDDTDFILNPFDARCVPWSPTAEMESPWDAEALAKSIIPNGTGESKEWNSYAQTFLMSVLQRMWEAKKLSLEDLLHYVQAADMAELETFLNGTPAAAQLFSDKTFGSIRTIATNYLSAYNYLKEADEYLAITEFVRAQNGGFLFMTYRDDQLDSLRGLFSCILDIAARAILSLEANPKRRVWLVIDEFASIGKVQSIEAVATKARKTGGCLIVGIQSIAQIKDRYGEHMAQTIVSCLSSWLVLRCSDVDTADYMSRYIGEEQIVRTTEGKSTSDASNSKSWNEQSMTQRVIMTSQIQQLGNLCGFLKIAGHYPICEVKLNLPGRREVDVASYEKRDFKTQPTVKAKAPATNPGLSTDNSSRPAAESEIKLAPIRHQPVPAESAVKRVSLRK